MSKKITSLLLLSVSVTGCTTAMNSSPLALHSETGQSGSFVEAWIEQVGPPAKWAGPQSFLVHVSARDPKLTEISFAPELFPKRSWDLQGRTPAANAFTLEAAREELHFLASAIEGESTPEFRGCMYPVRVRLVRGDGSILEKQGCRAAYGWPNTANRMIASLLERAHGK